MTAPKISADGRRLTVNIPLTIRRRGGRKIVVAPQGEYPQAMQRRVDSTLVKAIARAYRWQGMLEDSTYSTLRELSAAERISPSYVSRMLRLTLLAPQMVESILDGTAGDDASASFADASSHLWSQQLRDCEG